MWLMLLVSMAYGSSCNQKMYDRVYRTIVIQTMKRPMTKKSYDIRNEAIENLRKLCKGQRASWEGK
jgi:hypothetical protein